VNIGVPYGTHIWQVADSAEMNSSFKSALAKAKRIYKDDNVDGSKNGFLASDIIPLRQMAWKESFARADKAKRATADCGWGPLNWILLDDPLIKHTAPSSLLSGGNVSNNNHSTNNNLANNGLNSDRNANNCTSSQRDEIIQQLNFDSEYTNKVATMCVERRLMDKGKNEFYLKQKEKEAMNKEGRGEMREFFKNPKNYQSGKAAAANKYCLTNDYIVDGAQDQQTEKDQKRKATKDFNDARDAKRAKAFKLAFKKYVMKETLYKHDMRALLLKLKGNKKGPAIPDDKDELIAMLAQRKNELDAFIVEDDTEHR
jgi:hypothetical protein